MKRGVGVGRSIFRGEEKRQKFEVRMVKRADSEESVGKEGTSKNGKLLSEESKIKKKITFREEKEEGNIESELRKLKVWVQEKINGIKESLKV